MLEFLFCVFFCPHFADLWWKRIISVVDQREMFRMCDFDPKFKRFAEDETDCWDLSLPLATLSSIITWYLWWVTLCHFGSRGSKTQNLKQLCTTFDLSHFGIFELYSISLVVHSTFSLSSSQTPMEIFLPLCAFQPVSEVCILSQWIRKYWQKFAV